MQFSLWGRAEHWLEFWIGRPACPGDQAPRSGASRPANWKSGLVTIDSLRRLVDFYMRQHNKVTPHAAFEGQTPDEMYFGDGDSVAAKLAAARIKEREQRHVDSRPGRKLHDQANSATRDIVSAGPDRGQNRS